VSLLSACTRALTFENLFPGKKEDKPQKDTAAKPALQDGKGKESGEAKKEGGKKVNLLNVLDFLCGCVGVWVCGCVGVCVCVCVCVGGWVGVWVCVCLRARARAYASVCMR
jgi:hypothetical protein